ncbi:MAG: hypothetical protein N3E45_15275 [Oscillatoriaceae bacterium SKW80]|nr:hypothetical protein [Oscillatoriaceae bacterium SKYG93]MCX8122160.1 hypothetical protein [Oscillatoriaceae bacterium SKW80]MDW8454447.1 hypothetical protein [Oscillatoriaceae cyanobacterium SKYGB_i_bin93]HIK29311.1 hypothetical protein [Oscillatoriaceae cyanobacterium M7585_C2015_266]
MNPENFAEMIQKGFRVTLGATSALIESIQDSAKREETLSKMRSNFAQLTEEWAEKGALTEQEARNFVDSLLKQQSQPPGGETSTAGGTNATDVASSKTDSQIQKELLELTAELAALRNELQKLQNSEEN